MSNNRWTLITDDGGPELIRREGTLQDLLPHLPTWAHGPLRVADKTADSRVGASMSYHDGEAGFTVYLHEEDV